MAASVASRASRPEKTSRPAGVIDMIDGIGGVLAGPANVIMQLSWPEVGYGVVESKVDSGKITKHPVKRARTTFTYLSVALFGSDDERAVYRKAVNRSHAQVHSGPDSPVEYNAFNTDLQLWVAACLYYGAADIAERFMGPLSDEEADALYEAAKPMGTTLQVKPEMWPADRAAFKEYWEDALTKVSIDPTVRRYLYDLVALKHLPLVIQRIQARYSLWVTTGFLPPLFREQMKLDWSDEDEARFDRHIKKLAAFSRRMPAVIRRFPFNYFLWDFRIRVKLHLPLV